MPSFSILPRILQSRRTPEYFSYAVTLGSLCVVVECIEPLSLEEQSIAMHVITHYMKTADIHDLVSCNAWGDNLLQNSKLPPSTTFAIACVHNDILYVKTKGASSIILLRNNASTLLLTGDRSASGFIQAGDRFAFVSVRCMATKGKEVFTHLLSEFKTQSAIEAELVENPIEGSALCIAFEEKEKENVVQEKPREVKREEQSHTVSSPTSQVRKKRLLLFFVLIGIGLLLVWSIGSGYQRRAAKVELQKIQEAKTTIEEQLQKAQDSSTTSPAQAGQFIQEAKQAFQLLQQGLYYEKQNEMIINLQKEITSADDQLTKKTQKKETEFMDIALDSQNAKPISMVVSDEVLGLLDANGTTAYLISIENKSIHKKIISSLSGNQKLLLHQGNTVFLFDKNKGLYKSQGNNNSAFVTPTGDWNDVVDASLYNGNLYVLDAGARSIYKYISASDGVVATKSAYLSEAASLAQAQSMAIDGSIYIALPKTVLKYTSGAGQDFTLSLPDQNSAHFDKVITTKESDHIFLWDKNNNKIYQTKKDGTYEQQFTSEHLKEAQDIALYQSELFVLSGTKVYSIGL